MATLKEALQWENEDANAGRVGLNMGPSEHMGHYATPAREAAWAKLPDVAAMDKETFLQHLNHAMTGEGPWHPAGDYVANILCGGC